MATNGQEIFKDHKLTIGLDLGDRSIQAQKLTYVPAESYIEKWFESHADKLPTNGGQIRIDLNEVQILSKASGVGY